MLLVDLSWMAEIRIVPGHWSTEIIFRSSTGILFAGLYSKSGASLDGIYIAVWLETSVGPSQVNPVENQPHTLGSDRTHFNAGAGGAEESDLVGRDKLERLDPFWTAVRSASLPISVILAFLPRYSVCNVELPCISICMHSAEKSDKEVSINESLVKEVFWSKDPQIGSTFEKWGGCRDALIRM